MKKSLILAALVAAMSVCSCSDNPVGPQKLTDIYLTDFGFYAENNPALENDILIQDLDKTASINVSLPHEIAPSVLKTLVIRYGKSAENIEVSLGDGTVLDGLDTLDFQSPVEIRLTDGSNYWAYTVTVALEESKTWAKVATTAIADTLYTSPKVAYDEKNDVFYVLDCYRKKGDLNYPVLYTFKNGALSEPLVLAESRTNSALGVEVLDGEAYVAYADYGATTSQMITVVKVSGSTITPLGGRGDLFKCATVDDVCVLPIASDKVYAAYQNSATVTGVLTKRLLQLAKWDGTAWTNGNSVPNRTASNYGYQTRSQMVNGDAYLAVFNQNVSTLSVISANSTSAPTEAFEAHVAAFDGTVMTTTSSLGLFDFYIDMEAKKVFFAVQNAETAGVFNLSVQESDFANNGKFSPYGDVIPGTTTSRGGIYPSITSKNGVPYVAYQGNDAECRLNVASIDPVSKTWKVEVVSNTAVGGDPVIMKDKNGKLFVFALNSKANAIEVYSPVE